MSAERLILWHRMAPRSPGPSGGARREEGEPAAILAWSRSVRARLLAAGGEILAQVSGTVVAEFDPGDASDVLEVALDLLVDADENAVPIALGIALGPVEGGAGRAVEVAELLATRAQVGELVLDPAARERAEGLFLFGRQVSTGVGGPRGAAVDRAHPRRDALAEGIARLAPVPIAPITATCVEGFVEAAKGDPAPAIVLRAPVGAGALELVAEAARIARPRALLGVGAAAGGIVPLASLRYALARSFGRDDAIAAACGADDEGQSAARVLRTTLRGGLPPREALAASLGLFLARAGDPDRDTPAWAFLTPLAMVDAATLDVLLDAREHGAPIVLVARYPVDARLPAGIAEPVHEITVPPLRTSDARAIAEVVLGEGTDPEVARKVAVLGGETPLGVIEVARALIASGDLVWTEGGFEWRGAPRAGAASLPLEEIVGERLERLDDEARRALEAICVAPEGAPRELADAIALRDGLSEKGRARAIDQLLREAWISAQGPWPALAVQAAAGERLHPSTTFLRRLVLQGMPPSRAAELHRFVAEALIERGAEEAALASLRAELGYFEIEGGLEERGAARLAEVARVAIDRGYRRAAARIGSLLARLGAVDAEAVSRAAVTVPPPSSWEDEAPPSSSEIALDQLEPETMAIALPPEPASPGEPVAVEPVRGEPVAVEPVRGEPVRGEPVRGEPVRGEPVRGEPVGERTSRSSFVTEAEDAVRRHDLEALDGLMQRAVASGSDMAAVARFRALADLLRGDLGGAQRAIAKARSTHARRGQGDPREAIAEAAVALGSGNAGGAVRLGVRALALARRAGDPRGEHAALKTLAACYRALGRDDDAARLEAIGA